MPVDRDGGTPIRTDAQSAPGIAETPRERRRLDRCRTRSAVAACHYNARVNVVSVYRGGLVESVHAGSIVVVDSTGKLLAHAGNPNLLTYLRSAAKPFQTLPLLEEGGAEEYDLTPQEIALISASHGGESKHVSTAAAILRKGEFDETDLQCGAHMPYDSRAATELRQSGELPSALHNNCSGKHGGMLLACQLIDAPTASYLEPDHPLQQRILEVISDFSGVAPPEIPVAVDGCGVPAFYMSLYRAAFAYARLAATAFDAAGAVSEHDDASRGVFEAMTGEPSFVAGSWSITTPLIEAFDGRLLAKEGAEAFYAMAVSPELAATALARLGVSSGAAIGIALKVHDGSASRARDPVVLETLQQVGLPAESPLLDRYRHGLVKNVVGRTVGEIRAEFDLQFM